ncbi:MAG TPA: coproporphyrinogen III oxidase, partial [Mycobacteriales bacterium]|nr:coproporphyrinogen III oxidase [Mycobacteriales bacterium]
SNWARNAAARCQHNLGYWSGDDWWGVGPGAHSHVAGIRWWNVKHPAAYTARLFAGGSPAAGREVLGPEQRHLERVMLAVRLSSGLARSDLGAEGATGAAAAAAAQAQADGLLSQVGDRLVLTRRGRLLADAVVRALVP